MSLLKKLFAGALFSTSAACSAAPPGPGVVTQVDGAGARAAVAAGATLVDVRTAGEFSARRVDGAINIPVDQLGRRLGEVPKDKAVVVYCQSGRRSASAAATLAAAGYDARDLGGIGRW
jgi:rhodanese-related sulfurtransferase